MADTEDTEALDAEALVARDLTYAIMRFYGYTEADIAEAESVHPGRVCSEDSENCFDEDGESVHPRSYDELGGTSSTVVEIILPWLAARDERIRADEREKLAAVEALARRDCLVAALRTPRIGDRGACARSAEISRTAERGETGGGSALTCPMCGTEGIPLRPPVKRGQA